MKRGLIKVICSVVSISMILVGCSSGQAKSNNEEGKYIKGTYTATAKGFGGEIKVEVTVDEASITNVVVTGESETDGIGTNAIEQLPEKIKEANSIDVDIVSGATVTSKAILSATQLALDKSMGKEQAEVKMIPGEYVAEAQGFAKAEKLSVKVTVSETEILSIEVNEDNGETKPILDEVIELFIPRVIENQSLAVDSICGATTSNNAVRSAVEVALTEALTKANIPTTAIQNFYKEIAKSDKVEELTTDILVIGMGGSGMTAAVSAAEELYEQNGKDASKVNVLGIEKAGKLGGTSALTSSPMVVNQPSKVEARGEEYVDADALREDWYEYTEGDAKEELVDFLIDNSGEAAEWLEDMGFVFGEPEYGFGTPYQVVSYYNGSMGGNKEIINSYFDSMTKHYEDVGGKYLLETEGTELIIEDNKVVGAKAINADGTQYIIKADAVILAGGGFAGSGDMMEKYLSDEYYPLKGVWNLYGSSQNDGKTIQMAIDAGAGTYNISVPPMTHIGGASQIMHEFEVNEIEGQTDMWTGRTATWSLNDIPMVMAVSPDSIAVNRDGYRFTDESGLAMMDPWKAGPNFYSIWSDERIKDIQENGFEYVSTGLFINQGGVPASTPMPEIYDVLDAAIEQGYVYKADTIEELAEKIGVDKDILKENIESYNEYCSSGIANGEIEKAKFVTDIMGNELAPANYLKEVGNGPYYAITGASWCYSTAGGLDIDESFRVLKDDGTTAIDGLYAVGTDSIGVVLTEKKEYVKYGGAAQGWAFTSGKAAGENAVSYIKE